MALDLFEPDVREAAWRRRGGDHRRYPSSRSALLPCCTWSGRGRLPDSGRNLLSAPGRLDLTDAEVTAVATFYSMYRRTPTGRLPRRVCANTLCAIMGGDAILDTLENIWVSRR